MLTIVISFAIGCAITYVIGMRIWLVQQVGHTVNDIYNDLTYIEHIEINSSANVAELIKTKLACESALLEHLTTLPLAPEPSGLTVKVLAESEQYRKNCKIEFSS